MCTIYCKNDIKLNNTGRIAFNMGVIHSEDAVPTTICFGLPVYMAAGVFRVMATGHGYYAACGKAMHLVHPCHYSDHAV